MTLPKAKRGFRKIIVRGIAFNWRMDGIVDIRLDSKKQNKITVDFGWIDEWLHINDGENRTADVRSKIITPAFVRQAIEFALDHNWNIDQTAGLMRLKYRNGEFEIILSK